MFIKIGDLVTIGHYFGVVIETHEYSCVVRWINHNNYKSSHGYKMLCKVSE